MKRNEFKLDDITIHRADDWLHISCRGFMHSLLFNTQDLAELVLFFQKLNGEDKLAKVGKYEVSFEVLNEEELNIAFMNASGMSIIFMDKSMFPFFCLWLDKESYLDEGWQK